MYVSIIISLFSGIFLSGIFVNGFELILTHILVPVINYINKKNNKPYKLKIVHFIEESENINEEKKYESEDESECLNQKEYDDNINALLNKIRLVNNKSKKIYLDENLD